MNSLDVVAELGYLALGTRLKRLAEQLQSGVAEILAESGESVQPGQLPLLVAIDRGGSLTVASLVEAIGVSQPAVSRMLGTLQRSGLVKIEADPDDARIRRITLTAKSRELLRSIREHIFPKVAAAAEQLCAGTSLRHALCVIERRNRDLPFAERIRRVQQ